MLAPLFLYNEGQMHLYPSVVLYLYGKVLLKQQNMLKYKNDCLFYNECQMHLYLSVVLYLYGKVLLKQHLR